MVDGEALAPLSADAPSSEALEVKEIACGAEHHAMPLIRAERAADAPVGGAVGPPGIDGGSSCRAGSKPHAVMRTVVAIASATSNTRTAMEGTKRQRVIGARHPASVFICPKSDAASSNRPVPAIAQRHRSGCHHGQRCASIGCSRLMPTSGACAFLPTRPSPDSSPAPSTHGNRTLTPCSCPLALECARPDFLARCVTFRSVPPCSQPHVFVRPRYV